jgi:KipI family sensor histidine kinase inhibitor
VTIVSDGAGSRPSGSRAPGTGSDSTAVASAWKWVGERALLREIDGADVASTNQSARALYDAIRARGLAEIEDLIPGARSLLVLLRPDNMPSADLLAMLGGPPPGGGAPTTSTTHEILVSYGGRAGPDLDEVARLRGFGPDALVALHSSVLYTVGFLGFAPGFAYLLGMPGEIATARLATPRTHVPAGSVAIGGEYTAVYPRESPGGWRIIGRAETTLFDPLADPPARLLPGDRVRFVPRS